MLAVSHGLLAYSRSHIDKATYRGYIDEIIDVLEGRPAPILKQLKEDMEVFVREESRL